MSSHTRLFRLSKKRKSRPYVRLFNNTKKKQQVQQLVKLGFTFKNGGNLTRRPAGWRYRGVAPITVYDQMWRPRVRIFGYGATIVPRFEIWFDGKPQGFSKVNLRDHKTNLILFSKEVENLDEVRKLKQALEEWLGQEYPKWKDPTAYWETD